ncbi:MAG: type I methionyl aminopeptidase [Bacteroidetes bacterium]|jgi:methionyl aminopeptidase|nr:type I methionyl aminopeptidase [Bacteroidota bacterium]
MVFYKTPAEIELMRESNLLVCKTHALVASLLRPGITGEELDSEAETFIRDHDAEPGFKGYQGFPATLCISPNEQVVHGIPNDIPFSEGDVISFDCGVLKNGFYGDAAYTFLLGEVDAEAVELCRVTKESLAKGIRAARVGNKVGDISFAIQDYAERKNGYGIVRELVGHGVGRNLHEAPEVPNFGRRNKGARLKDGLVLAIEPMVNLGTKKIKQHKDGWTVTTKDKKVSAHYEHSVHISKKGPDILSNHDIIEEAIKSNDNIMQVD